MSTPPASTSGSFLTLRSTITRSAASGSSGPWWTTSWASGVIRSDTRDPRRVDESHVALGQQPDQPPMRRRHHQRADTRAAPSSDAASSSDAPGAMLARIGDDAVLRALDDLDFAHLRLDLAGTEAAVDDADAALLGLHDGHRRARDGVHVGRDDRPLQRDAGVTAATTDRSSPGRAARARCAAATG